MYLFMYFYIRWNTQKQYRHLVLYSYSAICLQTLFNLVRPIDYTLNLKNLYYTMLIQPERNH